MRAKKPSKRKVKDLKVAKKKATTVKAGAASNRGLLIVGVDDVRNK